MTLETAVATIQSELHTLHEQLMLLRTGVADKPPVDDVVLVDWYGDATDDLLGWLEGALLAANGAQQAVSPHPPDLHQLWRCLSECGAHIQQIQQRYIVELAGYARLHELLRFGRRRGGEWELWTQAIHLALDACQPPLFAVESALAGGWQELGERLGMNSITIRTLSIGQQHLGQGDGRV